MSSWKSALRKVTERLRPDFVGPLFERKNIDWERLVSIDFETYYDAEYSLTKLSTSEYVRDPRFKAQMMALKIGSKPTRVIAANKIATELKKINWATHSVLCHNTQFDGFILSHHYGITPSYYCDTLSMARGLHSNDIGAGLEEVSIHYGGSGKLKDILETTKGVRDWPPALFAAVTPYCANDNEEMYRVFKEMHQSLPADEMDLIDLTIRMFCDPVLFVDIPRVEKELARELAERDALMASVINPALYYDDKTVLKKKAERALTGKERDDLVIKRVIGSNEKYAALLSAENVEIPMKISASWMAKPKDQRLDEDKYTYAFAKDDIDFINLPDNQELWYDKLDLNDPEQVKIMVAKQDRLRALVDVRIAVKSTTNITRAQRFLTAGANGMPLPVGYAYYRAHTGRFGGNNKMNMQNLTRGGELRQSILAPPGHVLCVADSGQIEARVNAWLWGQNDLLDSFRAADSWDKSLGVAHGADRDAYCKFADIVYNREITTEDKLERFVGKVCVLGLGFQMGAPKFQITLAKGALGGPPVFFPLEKCKDIVYSYRRVNNKIVNGWSICDSIITDMAAGRKGEHGPLQWEANTLWLPNGMCLKYPDLRQVVTERGWNEWTYQAKDMRKKIYAGLLCENIVQALARIIVASSQMLEISRTMRVVMTTHDEIVTCVKKQAADLSFKRMMKIMTTPPDWCPDIPLAAEGGYAENYSK